MSDTFSLEGKHLPSQPIQCPSFLLPFDLGNGNVVSFDVFDAELTIESVEDEDHQAWWAKVADLLSRKVGVELSASQAMIVVEHVRVAWNTLKKSSDNALRSAFGIESTPGN